MLVFCEDSSLMTGKNLFPKHLLMGPWFLLKRACSLACIEFATPSKRLLSEFSPENHLHLSNLSRWGVRLILGLEVEETVCSFSEVLLLEEGRPSSRLFVGRVPEEASIFRREFCTSQHLP